VNERINSAAHQVAPNQIAVVAELDAYAPSIPSMVESLRGRSGRESLGQHSMHCLPLIIGNQYGFVLKSMVSWTALWNGGPDHSDTKIMIEEPAEANGIQLVSSHFGNGIITVQNRFHFRTAPGVNLMVLDPPNYFLPNLSNLFAVVETDNLRRDFTFNLKIVTPKKRVRVKKGDIISGIIPIPRYYVDDFAVTLADKIFPPEVIAEEVAHCQKFGHLRDNEDKAKPLQVGKLYWRGLDADQNAFADHQRKLRPAGWSDEAAAEPAKKGLLRRLFARG
jgi:hypothetical protein